MRDLPLDISLLVENILDPDHGVFAHQAVGFDYYSASNQHKQTVTVEEPDDGLENGRNIKSDGWLYSIRRWN